MLEENIRNSWLLYAPLRKIRGDAAAKKLAAVSGFCPVFELNRTKIFHVKHFCPIQGLNLTRTHTERRLLWVGIARINRPMSRLDHDRKLGTNSRSFRT
jgi:hypothetical protein